MLVKSCKPIVIVNFNQCDFKSNSIAKFKKWNIQDNQQEVASRKFWATVSDSEE